MLSIVAVLKKKDVLKVLSLEATKNVSFLSRERMDLVGIV